MLATLAVILSLAPGLDLAVSARFWDHASGTFVRGDGALRVIHYGFRFLVAVLAIGLVLVRVRIWWTKAPCCGLTRAQARYLLLGLALGPGLLVELGVKEHWGRARPYQVEQFGGDRRFTAALEPTDDRHGHSFVSGHAAAAFYLLAFCRFARGGGKRLLLECAVLCFGFLIGMCRVVTGKHFLSDVVFAALLVQLVLWLLHRWILVSALPDRAASPAHAAA